MRQYNKNIVHQHRRKGSTLATTQNLDFCWIPKIICTVLIDTHWNFSRHYRLQIIQIFYHYFMNGLAEARHQDFCQPNSRH
jgi:hypothetical protein